MGRLWKTIKPMFGRCRHWRIVKGDTVLITTGKDRGEIGKVLEVIQDVRKPRVIIDGKNMVTRRIPKTIEEAGRIVTKEAPLHYSNVRLLDPQTNKPVRVAFRFLADGTRVRIGVGKNASNTIIPYPERPVKDPIPPNYKPGEKDTISEEASKRTFFED